mmetsp:Transcript_22593/g.66355  ORF Transcript_22593/g.66355 Transcript_22593/m.66355 type:complete len:463 (-) Transcript_22593:613-2001(-)
MTRTHTFTSGRLCLTHLPLSVCLLAGRWGEGGDLVCSNLRRSSRYARDICRTTWRHLLSELFRARKINEAGDCGATRGPCRCLFSSLQSERHPQRHLVGRRHARAPVHLSGRPPGHAAPQLDAAVVAPEAAAASAKDPDHVSEVRASRPSSDRVHAAERDALLALCRLRLLRHQAHAAQAAAGRGRGAVAGHAAQRPEHRGGRLQPRNHRPAVEVVHVRGRVAGRRAGVDRGGQRPHLEVVEDDARRRHLSLGRVDPRQVPLPSARRLERPRRLAVSRVPRPERARVVRGGGHREGLEAVPLGEERDDRLVVPMLAESRVLLGSGTRWVGNWSCRCSRKAGSCGVAHSAHSQPGGRLARCSQPGGSCLLQGTSSLRSRSGSVATCSHSRRNCTANGVLRSTTTPPYTCAVSSIASVALSARTSSALDHCRSVQHGKWMSATPRSAFWPRQKSADASSVMVRS